MTDLFKDDCQILQEETYSEYLDRFKGFGKTLYHEIKLEVPSVFNKLKLYKAIKSTGKCVGFYPQDLDSYAHYYSEKISFKIYIDPESEVIGIYNYDFRFETGYWSEKPTTEIIMLIKTEILPKTTYV